MGTDTAPLQMPQLEVWFQRASDVVRKLSYGDMDLGIVGLDMYAELSYDDPDLVVVHDALDFGHCHLALGVPMGGRFAGVLTKSLSWIIDASAQADHSGMHTCVYKAEIE